MQPKQKILILGGGFGGIKAALELCKDKHFDVTLLSDQTNFRYYPQLYHAATGGSSLAASIPLSEIFKGKMIKLIHDQAVKLNRTARTVSGQSGKAYNFDSLIIALGVTTNYFGIKGLKEYAYGIKSLEEAKRFREHLHSLLVDDKKPDINYVVIGGGPTGVELAGALPAYIDHIMKRHNIEGSTHIDLVEAAPTLVPRMPTRYSKAIEKRLQKLGVQLYLGQTVQAENADSLMVSGHSIDSHTVVWTAGVANHPFFTDNDFKLSEHKRAIVDEYLQSEPGIYVIGDNAETEFSGMAQTALYDGRFVARNLIWQARGLAMQAYRPHRPIYVTPVGSGWAAVQWGKLQISGWLGWLLRSAADLIAYHDLEPWWPASHHWLAETSTEESCPICSGKR